MFYLKCPFLQDTIIFKHFVYFISLYLKFVLCILVPSLVLFPLIFKIYFISEVIFFYIVSFYCNQNLSLPFWYHHVLYCFFLLHFKYLVVILFPLYTVFLFSFITSAKVRHCWCNIGAKTIMFFFFIHSYVLVLQHTLYRW